MTTTGPHTPAGKAVVALNSLRHGLRTVAIVIPGVESEDEWLSFRDAIFDDYAPVGPVEEALAQRAAECLWRLRRVPRAECASIVDRAADRDRTRKFREAVQANPNLTAVHKNMFNPEALPTFAPIPHDARIELIVRYEAHLARQFHQADHELEARRSRRQGRPSPPARLEVSAAP